MAGEGGDEGVVVEESGERNAREEGVGVAEVGVGREGAEG